MLKIHTHTHTRGIGPSVLDVFRTLVRHLRISIEDQGPSVEASTNSAFQVSSSLRERESVCVWGGGE